MNDMSLTPGEIQTNRFEGAVINADGSVRGKVIGEDFPSTTYREMPITPDVPEAPVTTETKSPFTELASRVNPDKLQMVAAYERITDPSDPRIFNPNSAGSWATLLIRYQRPR